MSEKKIGLVLAGGGALGSYEVGALKALDELNYKFSIVTGTSIGGLIGAYYCAGQLEDLPKICEGMTAETVMREGFDFNGKMLTNPNSESIKDMAAWAGVYLKNKGGADITPFKEYVKNTLNTEKAMQSPIKFGVVTSKFPSFTPADICMNQITNPDLYRAFLHATSACFPFFPIETIDRKKYVDGFYNDNLPIRLAFEYDADEVIAVDMRLFQLKPQNDFFLNLPNVHYIAPYFSLGSMLDFSHDAIMNNMNLGYLDTMKHFKKLRGFYFAFKGEIKSEGFMSDIIHSFGVDSEYIVKELAKGIRGEMDETDYFVRSIEALALRLKIDNFYQAYTVEEFSEIIAEKVKSLKYKGEANNIFTKTFSKITETLDSKKNRIKNSFLISFSKKYLGLVDASGNALISENMIFNK